MGVVNLHGLTEVTFGKLTVKKCAFDHLPASICATQLQSLDNGLPSPAKAALSLGKKAE
jgi:hypothetical protein